MARETKEQDMVSPVDLPGEPIDDGHTLGWTSIAIAVAAAVLLFANAGTLSAWVDEKPASEPQLRASEIAHGWTSAMDAVGITAPRNALHGVWKQLQAARFGDEAPGEAQ